MVLWFQHGSGYPIYSFDVRGKPMSQASHWSDPNIFANRAFFRTLAKPAELVIEHIRRHEEGIYRCRVDFRNAQTRSFNYNLTVIVPPEPPIIVDRRGRPLNRTVGPHEVGDDVILICRAVGGHPKPVVRWLMNNKTVDDKYEHQAGTVIENQLRWPSVSRKDLDANFTCQAENTNLTEPKSASVILELILKPLTVNISISDSPLVADRRYEISCKSTGSRPPAIITWYKGKRNLRKAKEEIVENDTSISLLSFTPTTEDDGKLITCRAENPDASNLHEQDSWKINVVYPPIVHLSLGSTLNASDIKEGDDVYFECKVRANPVWKKLTWIHNDIEIPYNVGRIIRSNQSLVLQKVTKQSAGVYKCSVLNEEGETVSDEFHFRVQYAPTCKHDKIIIVGASRGESIDVVCEIESDPPAKSYKWKFNNSGETLELETERYAKTSNGTVSILKYVPTSELDYGSLSCWAFNAVGSQVNPCVFQVVAAGKPLPVKNCTLTNQTSNSVEVYCQPGFDGGLPQHFLLELYTTNSEILRYNITSYTEPYFFLDNLETDITFRIVVFAVNSKGRSSGVVLEEVTFRDAEKRTAADGDLGISPVLGTLIGASITIIIIIAIVILRVRKSQGRPQVMLEEKIPGVPGHCNTMSSTKPLLRSASPRDMDEKDPDIIPAKYGAAENGDNHLIALNGPQVPTHSGVTVNVSYPSEVSGHEWSSPVSPVSIKQVNQYHQYSNPVAMVGTFPRDSRPKDLCLGNGSSSTLARASDLELNGLAIKERLMANRLPESCV
ncbi:neural cell adhesion molecule 2 isoform X1 [Euwallacea fornicatus]|uniref:neural cell adhesion molecule 2 isoform X1 n=1 Tax=Euwallacea fornicatus TaxID=995702 RepID=UPI00338F68DF